MLDKSHQIESLILGGRDFIHDAPDGIFLIFP